MSFYYLIIWLMRSVRDAGGKSSLFLALWKMENFGYLRFKGSFFEINHSLVFCSSLFPFEKRDSYVLVFKKWVCINSKHCSIIKLEELVRLYTYIKFNIGPRIDPCSTPHVIFCSFMLLSLLMQIYCFLFVNYILKQARSLPVIP